MGSLNSDCWYMYTLKDFSKPISSEPDQTIEILMSDLDQEIMKIFHQTNSHTAKEAREKSKIDQLMPNMKIDDYLFSPCGYSLNGVLLNVSLWQREMRITLTDWNIRIPRITAWENMSPSTSLLNQTSAMSALSRTCQLPLTWRLSPTYWTLSTQGNLSWQYLLPRWGKCCSSGDFMLVNY